MDKDGAEKQNLDRYTTNKLEKGIKDLHEEKDLKIQWRLELEQNLFVPAYFENYHASSSASFIDNYVNQKFLWHKYGDFYREQAEKKRSKWINQAHDQLEVILQKKLFDIQCLWRAEHLQLDGISVSFDFHIWKDDILNCPFLETITEEDIAMYTDFLLQGDIELRDLGYHDWQNYEEIKEAQESNFGQETTSDWYEFYNKRTGCGALLLLPDTRGEKESFYKQLKITAAKAENDGRITEQPIIHDSRPFMDYYDKNIIEKFVSTFEQGETRKKHKNYTEGRGHSNYDEIHYREIFETIMSLEEPVPVVSNGDFKEAMLRAYNDYSLKKIAEHLPLAHEQYLFNKKMGFSSEKKDNMYREMRHRVIDHILDGRELNGEERNLEF